MIKDNRQHPFRDSQQDRDAASHIPDTPQTRAPSYALAFADDDFMLREELRPVRLQLELLKPELLMNEAKVEFDHRAVRWRAHSRTGEEGDRADANLGGFVEILRRGAALLRR